VLRVGCYSFGPYKRAVRADESANGQFFGASLTVSEWVGFETTGGASKIRGPSVLNLVVKLSKNAARRELKISVDAVAELCL